MKGIVPGRGQWQLMSSVGGDQPKGEDEAEEEDPSDGESLTNFMVAVRVILGEDHDQDHVDYQSARGVEQRELSSNFVDISKTDGVCDDSYHA